MITRIYVVDYAHPESAYAPTRGLVRTHVPKHNCYSYSVRYYRTATVAS